MVETKNQYAPDYVSAPGETLKDLLNERGMTQVELSERMGKTPKFVSELIQGKAALTQDTALQLERVLRTPASFWNNRERHYQEALARKAERVSLSKHTDWLKTFPLKDMIHLEWVTKEKDDVEQVRRVLDFFGVASPDEWNSIWMDPQYKASFRKSLAFASEPGAVAAWLRQGEIEGRAVECEPYDKQGFKDVLREIRTLTVERPEKFCPLMLELCSSVGVALVFLPQIDKARISGATRWLTSGKALIQMSLRYKTNDHFWFTFFHEAGHVVKHGKRAVFLEGSDADMQQDEEEEANVFASEWLIPRAALRGFIMRGETSKYSILQFAHEQGIAPGIVVGQLQHEGVFPYSHHNRLKEKFTWKKT